MNNFHMREGRVEFRWKRWRNKKRQEVSSCLMVLFSGVVLLGAGGVALAGPTGGQVTGGTGTITNPDGTTTNINQTSNVLSINWQDFSIQTGETVNFYQPGSTSVAINRVIGGVPSYLAGALNANGRVFILNSAGITFTGTSQVNVGALLATTAMTVNGDPSLVASYSGTGYGAVINQGSISVSNGGFAILAAPYVQNTGFIKADLGTIALAGTNQFTLDLSGTGLINFVVPAGAVEKIVSDGKAVGVDNSGTLQARSGQVIISANVASEVVNAVVNLNGVVDADAFAPNGQGGSVLVTGDAINIGGQVTARGSGAGNGGQIITKAVEGDNIEQMAFVSAAGGATGKGGFIEVSGKTVGLNGSIDPGKGGLLYVDPTNFTIRNATSGQTASGIGEHKLEALLQNGAGFLVNAAGNITIQDLTDNVLAGGPGDLTLHAGTAGAGNIVVLGVNDTIRTGGGDITLTAAGNIGDGTHRLSFISGTGLPGVNQAGDVVLKATNNGSIYVKNVTVKSAGVGDYHALFSANAANQFSAAGFIDVEAVASGHDADASAEVNLLARNHDIVRGAVTVLANAHGSSGSEQANATLIAAQAHSVIGNNVVTNAASSVHIWGAVNVAAIALDHSSAAAAAKAAAKAEALFAGKQVQVDGRTAVKATASGNDIHFVNGPANGGILACATLIAGAGTTNAAKGYWRTHPHAAHVHFQNAVDVEANAFGDSNLINFTKAHASAELYGAAVAVDGQATVKATVHGSGANNDIAAARLIVANSANSQNYGALLDDFGGGYIHFRKGIDVEAHVDGNSIGHAVDALAYAGLAGLQVYVDGNVSVLGDATGHGLPSALASTVWADAHFAIGNEMRRNDTAVGFYGSSGVPRNFSRTVHIGGALDLEAIESGSYLKGQGVYGNATADIRGGWIKPDIISINGPVTIRSLTSGTHVNTASADARIVFRVGSGQLHVPDHILIDAEATGHDANLTCAEARVHVYSSGAHPNATFISSDGITVLANANGSGNGPDFRGNEVFATASYSLQANHIRINPGADEGSLLARAEANGVHINNIIASAGGFVKSWNNGGTANVNVPLSVGAIAHGTGQNSHVGEILAVTYAAVHDPHIDMDPGRPGSPAILAWASASGHDVNLIKADAHGLLGETFGNDLAIEGPVVIRADANGHSAGSIIAIALAPEQAKGAQIQSLTVDAIASGSNVARNMLASAGFFARDGNLGITITDGLDVEAKTNGINVGGSICAHAEASFSDAGALQVNGVTNVVATASGNAVGDVHAVADLFADRAHNTPLSEIFDGSVDVEAHADVGLGGADSAAAEAMVNLAPLGNASIFGANSHVPALAVLASADPLGHAGIGVADASLDVNAGGNLFILGNVTVHAVGLGDGVFGSAHHDVADALMRLEAANVTVDGNLRSLALANGSWSRADASVAIHADGVSGDIQLLGLQNPLAKASAGSVNVLRQAHVTTSGQAFGLLNSTALAGISIELNGTLTAPP